MNTATPPLNLAQLNPGWKRLLKRFPSSSNLPRSPVRNQLSSSSTSERLPKGLIEETLAAISGVVREADSAVSAGV